MSVWAVIVAGGSGTRMGMPVNKALAPLAGKTVLERSLEAFDGLVDGAVVVYRAQDEDAVHALNLRARLAAAGCGNRAHPRRGKAVRARGDDTGMH